MTPMQLGSSLARMQQGSSSQPPTAAEAVLHAAAAARQHAMAYVVPSNACISQGALPESHAESHAAHRHPPYPPHLAIGGGVGGSNGGADSPAQWATAAHYAVQATTYHAAGTAPHQVAAQQQAAAAQQQAAAAMAHHQAAAAAATPHHAAVAAAHQRSAAAAAASPHLGEYYAALAARPHVGAFPHPALDPIAHQVRPLFASPACQRFICDATAATAVDMPSPQPPAILR